MGARRVGPPCPTAGRRPHPRPTAWAAALEPIRRARPRVTIAVHARQRTTTAGRPYTVAMVCGWPVGSGRRARPRAAAPTPRPTAGRRARPRAAAPWATLLATLLLRSLPTNGAAMRCSEQGLALWHAGSHL
ncbi:MAG: hypothetical protein H6638_10395 [Ardenticatenales bacterium]|nr:hypothetical protein [Ardenticatenales bacterium]